MPEFSLSYDDVTVDTWSDRTRKMLIKLAERAHELRPPIQMRGFLQETKHLAHELQEAAEASELGSFEVSVAPPEALFKSALVDLAAFATAANVVVESLGPAILEMPRWAQGPFLKTRDYLAAEVPVLAKAAAVIATRTPVLVTAEVESRGHRMTPLQIVRFARRAKSEDKGRRVLYTTWTSSPSTWLRPIDVKAAVCGHKRCTAQPGEWCVPGVSSWWDQHDSRVINAVVAAVRLAEDEQAGGDWPGEV